MKNIIEIEGKKYKKIEEDNSQDDIKGQGYVCFVFFSSIMMMFISAFIRKWDGVIISILIIVLCAGIGFEALDDIKDRLEKISK